MRSPPSAMELLVDWGVWGPWRDPEPAAEEEERTVISAAQKRTKDGVGSSTPDAPLSVHEDK